MIILRAALGKAGAVTASIASLVAGSLLAQEPAQALPTAITAPVNTTACSSTAPALLNGSFEEFSNPATDPTVTWGSHNGNAYYGVWHGYANGPDQILFLKPSATPGAGESANFVTGWRSTSPLIEIQRQVDTYTSQHNSAGVLSSTHSALSGVASAATTAAGGSYYDLYSGQAAAGTYWAELNAIDASALYQDVTVPSSARLFWSLKHRGRSNTNEEMKVLIGSVVNNVASTTQQTSIYKYSPTNANVYFGSPTYSTSFTSQSTIVSKLSDGWSRFEGTYAPDNSVNAPSSRTMRLQFEAVSGAFGWTSFGNMLDDIQFTALMACPATQSLTVGQTASVDVTGRIPGSNSLNMSYGVRQTLSALGNPTAPASEFNTSGNTVTFTPTAPGNYSVDYEVAMDFGGQSYSVASRINYNVAPDPNPPVTVSQSNSTPLASTGSSAIPSLVTGLALLVTGLALLVWRRRRA